MAGQADGSIIVDTEIDASGFKADSAELQRAIKSLNNKVEALGPTFQKALSGNASAMSTFDAKASALENTITELEARMKSLGEQRVPTEDYQWLTDEIEKAKNELIKLDEKQVKMEDLGVKKSSSSWKSLQYDIDLAKRKIAEYEAEQAQMRDQGTAFQMGTNTAEYAQLESSLASAKSRLEEMRTAAEGAGQSTSKLGSVAGFVRKAFAGIGKAGVTGFKAVVNGAKSAASKLKQFSKSSNGAMGAINKLGKKLTGLGSMFKRMALRKIMMGIITAIKEGFNNLAQYSSQTNADMSALKSSLTQLKNSFATAFAPILTTVVPILTKLIGHLSTAITYVGKLFAALSGAKTFTRAKEVQEDYAASLSGTSKAAEDAKKQLAGFDDLNVLSDSSSNDKSSGPDPSEMFEEVPIESSVTSFIDGLKNAFKNGEYDEIGKIIGEKINGVVQKINDFIKWDNVGGTITKVVSGIAEGFNSLIHTVDFNLIGDTLAQGLNTAINTLYLIITEFDWPGLAAQLANGLNGLVKGFDWSKLGTTLSTGVRTALATLRSAITTFDWASLGKGVADGINSIDWVGILSDIAGGVSDIVKAALDLVIGFAENLDWEKLGSDLWNGLIGIITNIDWGGIISKAFELLGMALAGAAKLVVGFCKALWESLKKGFEDMVNTYFKPYMNDMGKLSIEGFFKGIGDMLSGIGTWIKEHIFEPFINGFKKVFGIHSPSTVMAEMGGYLVEGLLNGIKNLWSSITDFFKNALDGIKNMCSQAWSSIKSAASTAWNGISNVVSSAWSGIKNGVSSACSAISSGVSSAWTTVKNTVSTKLNEAKTAASNAWNSIKSTASSVGSSIASTANTAWTNVKNYVTNNLNTAKTNASNAWNSIKSTASSIGSSIASTVSSAWTNVKNYVTNSLNTAKTNASNAWNSIKSTASSIGSSIASAANTAWTNVKNYVTNSLNTAKTNASNAWNSIKSTASSIGSSIASAASTAWTNVKNYVTNNLNTAKTNASNAWNSIKSTASSIGSSIASTVSSAWTNVKNYVTNNLNNAKSSASSAWDSIKSTASNVCNNIKSSVSSAWENVRSTVSSKLSSISSSASSTFTSLKNSATTWGKDLCQNMANGISSAASAVGNAVSNVASKIKSFLGFSEPEDGPLSNFHTYMPDMIDLMTYGIKKNQGTAIGAVADMASAISSEIQDGDYSLGNIKVDKGLSGSLENFSDKITDGFSNLLDRLQSIANGVTFNTPTVAAKGIAPYSVTAASGSNDTVSNAIEASNDELASVVTQVVANATTAIVGAIQSHSGTTVNLDANSLATSVINEINRRTRMSGRSPLVG